MELDDFASIADASARPLERGAVFIDIGKERLPSDLSNVTLVVKDASRWWAPIAGRLDEVRSLFFSTGDPVDLSPIEGMAGLQALDLDEMGGLRIARKIDVTGLCALRGFVGDPRKLANLNGLRRIENAVVLSGMGAGECSWQVSDLELRGMKDVSALRKFKDLSRLTRLNLTGVREVDLGLLPDSVKGLTIYGARRILGAGGLGVLEHLVLEDCPDIEDGEYLFDGRVRRVSSIGRRPFGGDRAWVGGSIPPKSDGEQLNSLVLVHPGLRRPLSYPDETLGSGPADRLLSSWEDKSDQKQAEELKDFFNRVGSRLAALEATTILLSDGAEVKIEASTLGSLLVDDLLEGGEVIRHGSQIVAIVSDDPSDGVLVPAHWAKFGLTY